MSKNGKVGGVQRYKCAACGRQFLSSYKLELQPEVLWQEYTTGKQTDAQLAAKYQCSSKTIQRKIDQVTVQQNTDFAAIANVVMDTTYFGRKLGVMVFKDSITSRILYKQYVKHETNKLYLSGIEEISRRGVKVKAIICDGRKGLLTSFKETPIQMCQFHQVAIIRRYLTRKPKLEAGKALWTHVQQLSTAKKEDFETGLTTWYNQWESFLNERKKDSAGKSRYVHKKLRSAYRSLETNLPWLFTFQAHPDLQIPNTTNALDGQFSDLKNKLRNHNGLSMERKKKVIDEFLKA